MRACNLVPTSYVMVPSLLAIPVADKSGSKSAEINVKVSSGSGSGELFTRTVIASIETRPITGHFSPTNEKIIITDP